MKLTKRVVDAAIADPEKDRTFLWDADLKGFGLLVTKRGAKSYVVQYRNRYRTIRRYTIGRHGAPWTCENARIEAGRLLREAADGGDPAARKIGDREAITVCELADTYLADGPAAKPNKKASSWSTDRSNIERHIKPLLGNLKVVELGPAKIAKFQADVAAGKNKADVKTKKRGLARVTGGKGTAARSLAVLSAMLQFGVKQKLCEGNPAKDVVALKPSKKQERFLSVAEVALLSEAFAEMAQWHPSNATVQPELTQSVSYRIASSKEKKRNVCSIPPVATAILSLLMLTGCRRDEIESLEWSCVDLERGFLNLLDSKTGKKVVNLPRAACAVLAPIERTKSRYVFPVRSGENYIKIAHIYWDALRRHATELGRRQALNRGEPGGSAPDLTKLRIHDLRHSYASFAIDDGASLFMVGKVLGHKQTRTTEIYAHLRDDPLRAIAEQTASKVSAALEEGKKQKAKMSGPAVDQ